MKKSKFKIVPLRIKQANNFVYEHHRYLKPVRLAKYALGCEYEDKLVGVVLVGVPLASAYNDGYTVEVTRLCCAGFAPVNTGSFLLGGAWKVWKAMGGRKMVSYTIDELPGTCYKAAGWRADGRNKGSKQGWKYKKGRTIQMFNEDTERIVALPKTRWVKEV